MLPALRQPSSRFNLFCYRSIPIAILLFQAICPVHRVMAQSGCSPSSANIINVCSGTVVEVGVGSMQSGFYYIWDTPSGSYVTTGNGNGLSFQYTIEGPEDEGYYRVTEESFDGSISNCMVNSYYDLPSNIPAVQTLAGGGILCSSGMIFSLSNSESNTTYTLVRNGVLTTNTAQGTGSGIVFLPVTETGWYKVKALYNGCSGGPAFTDSLLVTDPMALVINNTTVSSANLSWPGTGEFTLEYGLPGFTPGSGATAGAGGTVFTTSSSPVFIGGLAPNTIYSSYVRTTCSPGNYSNNVRKDFKTDCSSTISSFPYTEGFESPAWASLPACWKAIDTLNNASDAWTSSNSSARTGSRCLFSNSGDLAILPRLSLTGNQRLKFYVKSLTGFNARYRVKLSTGDNSPANFNNLLFEESGIPLGYTERVINLNSYSGLVYIAFQGSASEELVFDDLRIETIPACPGPSLVKLNSASANTASISWAGSGTFILEYGPSGFTPGTGASAGAGGTVISNAVSPRTISGLNPATVYDVYIRQNCSGTGNGYSANSPLTRISTFVDCSASTLLSLNVPINDFISTGTGTYDFYGIYPYNSVGEVAKGKEKLFSFTPASTGVYYLKTLEGEGITYYYKPASSGCTTLGWTGVKGNASYSPTAALGLLEQNVTYFILADPDHQFGTAISFEVGKASLSAAPSGWALLGGPISPGSTKIEYLVDESGNLIASFDFTGVTNKPGLVTGSASLHNGSVRRRDDNNIEYLDRAFRIYADENPEGLITMKLYFRDTELQQLIDEPNDGLGDVNSVNDLKVTSSPYELGFGKLMPAQSNGIFEPGSGFVEIITAHTGDFYLHGGAGALYKDKVICPQNILDGGDISFILPARAGTAYQWQVDQGNGFVNLAEAYPYSGVQSNRLYLDTIPRSFNGNKYRCLQTIGGVTTPTASQTLLIAMRWNGSNGNDWWQPENWDCSFSGPDSNTDVIIPSGVTNYPVIDFNNADCKKLTLKPGAKLTVNPAYKLTIVSQ